VVKERDEKIAVIHPRRGKKKRCGKENRSRFGRKSAGSNAAKGALMWRGHEDSNIKHENVPHEGVRGSGYKKKNLKGHRKL